MKQIMYFLKFLRQNQNNIIWLKKRTRLKKKYNDKYDDKKAENAQEIWELMSHDKSKDENDSVKSQEAKQKEKNSK